jgi:hypothetical protein
MVPRNQKWLMGVILVLLGGVVVFVIFDSAPALPAVMILPPGPLVVKSGRAPDRWIPSKWIWLRKACLLVLGRPRQVEFNVERFESSETAASVIARNSLGPPQAQSNGVAVWLLADWAFRPPKGRLIKHMPRARMITSDLGQGRVGFGDASADLFGRLQKRTVDLSTRVIVASALETNFVAAARAQLPYGQALLVLDVRQPESATNRFEFLLMADEIDAKGNMLHWKDRGK